jgi:hypothetical protein
VKHTIRWFGGVCRWMNGLNSSGSQHFHSAHIIAGVGGSGGRGRGVLQCK